uniref:B9R n=1 Tax=Variola major virus TaxID=12870 RepID=Q6Q8R4_VARV|nr:B9R [Variola major virus]
MDISYVINDNITFISNITSSTKYINSCVNSSLSLQIAVVRIPVLFNKTMERLGITPGSDLEAYFMCKLQDLIVT